MFTLIPHGKKVAKMYLFDLDTMCSSPGSRWSWSPEISFSTEVITVHESKGEFFYGRIFFYFGGEFLDIARELQNDLLDPAKRLVAVQTILRLAGKENENGNSVRGISSYNDLKMSENFVWSSGRHASAYRNNFLEILSILASTYTNWEKGAIPSGFTNPYSLSEKR